MSDILDQVLANTSRGNGIVSEQHDVTKINWVNGLSDPGEMISCGYLPAARRKEGEQDKEYAERIRPLMMAIPKEQRDKIMGAAIKRFGVDNTTGKIALMVAGEAAWSQLGVNVRHAQTGREAIVIASLNFKVNKETLWYTHNGVAYPSKKSWSLVRSDTGAELNVVGSGYKVIQNEDGFEYVDAVLGNHGAHWVTALSLRQGAKIGMQAEFPKQAFELPGGDKFMPYITFFNSHGDESAWIYPTEHREVCQNTHRVSFGANKDKGFCIRHTGDIMGKVQKANELLGISEQGFDNYKEETEQAWRTNLNFEKYADEVLECVLGVTDAQRKLDTNAYESTLAITEAEAKFEKIKSRKVDLLEEVLAIYESPTCFPKGSALAGREAFSQLAEHGSYAAPKRGSVEDKLSRRLESVLSGEADKLKQVAYQKATRA